MTLIELVAVLVVTGTLLGLSAPRLLGGADRWVVREAREELIGLLYRARMEARREGEARLVIEEGGPVELLAAGWDEPVLWDPGIAGVRIEIEGSRTRAEIVFGPSGTGRLANATLIVRKGREEARVVISSYGRVRR
jgi:type II secretory pathway pseudopilin PulG